MNVTKCKQCGAEIVRRGKRPGVFCSLECKGQWQQSQKPVDREWLYQKYSVEELSTYAIGAIVGRDPKRVYEWLVGYGIPTRSKNEAIIAMNQRPDTREKRRLHGRKLVHTAETKRKLSEARAGKHYPKLQGAGNGMYGRRGIKSNNWKGGCTPERQAFYSSREWALACVEVWRRDAAECQRCGIGQAERKLHVHHIVSFAVVELRAEASNLVLLCSKCHRWVHSKQNANGDFIHEPKG